MQLQAQGEENERAGLMGSRGRCQVKNPARLQFELTNVIRRKRKKERLLTLPELSKIHSTVYYATLGIMIDMGS